MATVLVETFQQSQKNVQKHKQLIGKLSKAHSRCQDCSGFNQEFFSCTLHAMAVFNREPAVERVLDFAVQFAMTTFAEEGDRNVFSFLLAKVMESNSSRDKGIRMRSMEIVKKMLDRLEDDAELDVDVCEELTDMLLIRLNDKIPAVRCQAALALSRLQDPGDPDCSIQKAFQRAMILDSSPDVRKTVLSHIFVRPDTIEIILSRTRDIKDLVRRTAYEVLAQRVIIRSLTIAQRRGVLSQGLADRSEIVRKACTAQLLPAWFKQCESDFVQYLKRMDVEGEDEWVEKSVMVLIETQSPAELVAGFLDYEECSQLLSSIRQEGGEPNADAAALTPETVFYWRCLCQHLRGLGSAAEEFLDQILPEGARLCPYLLRLVQDTGKSSVCDDEDDSMRVFVLQQLFKIAALLDFADEAGRRQLKDSVCKLLPMDNVPGALVPMLATCLRAVESSHDARMETLLEVISDIHVPLNEQTLDADQLHATLANMSLSVENVPLEALLKCLLVLQELLLDVTQPSLSPPLQALTDTLVLPCVQVTDPVIREAAVKCLGLCCLLSLNFARQHLLLFLQALEVDVECVQMTALRVVLDLLHTYGLNSFELKSAKPSADGDDDTAADAGAEKADEDGENEGEEASDQKSKIANNILSIVSRFLDSQNDELCHIAMLGFAKLLLAGRLVSSKILLRLFLLWFNPACDDDLMLRQMLASFFPVYASASRYNQEQMASILVPALTTVWNAPDNSPLAFINVNDLTQFLVEFSDARQLRSKPVATEDLQEQSVHEDLAVKIANKLLTDDDDIDERTLCRVLSLLHVTPSSSVSEELKALDTQLLEVVADKMALRYLAKFRANICGSGKVTKSRTSAKTPMRSRPTPARRTTTRTATRSVVAKKAIVEDSDEDSENAADEEVADVASSPVAPRQKLSRGCKSQSNLVEKQLIFSSSSEEESEPDLSDD